MPGITRALIPLLLEHGIAAINEAPNGAMYSTNVPPAFVWRDEDTANDVVNRPHGVAGVSPPSGKELLVMWWQGGNNVQEGGCGTMCLKQFPGSDVAVLFDWRGEDSGPCSRTKALRVSLRASLPCTLNAAGQSWVALSLR